MLINEVEHIVGLSQKSIRFYEKNGLLHPERNGLNDYRIYKDEDVAILKKIKFLRDLGVPIRELKMLKDGSLSLEDCIIDRIGKIEREEEKYKTVKDICEKIIASHQSYSDADLEKLFAEVNILGKEGFTMRDLKTSKTKKILGAICSSVIFGAFFIGIIGILTYFQITEAEKIPWIIYGFICFLLGLPAIGIVYNLIARIKEILGGEEDEASKY